MELQNWLDQLKQRRRSVRPQEIDARLTEAGFERRYGKGDHWVYTHPKVRYPLTIDPRKTHYFRRTCRRQSKRSRRCWPMRPIEEYLALPYRFCLIHDRDNEGNEGWVAEVEELPGCMSQGATAEEAVDRVRDAMLSWISVALEEGREIPEPRELAAYSGRFLVRLPRSLHAELVRAAEQEGTSLNQFVTTALAAAVGWRATTWA
jgi:antitoxin HicB